MRIAGWTSSLKRWAHTRPLLVDFGIAIGFAVAGVLTTARAGTAASAGPYEERDALGLALVLAATLPYAARRRAPAPVYVVTALAVVVLMLSGYDEGALPSVLVVGAYTVAARRPMPEVVAASAVVAVSLVVLLVSDVPQFGPGELLTSCAGYGAATLLGRAGLSRQQRLDALESQREEAALRAAADERLRIAQELHDIVAHSLGVIAVQAGVGLHVIDTDPAEAKRSFESISHASRSSLAEIRRLLGVVRSGQAGAAYIPAPGLSDLPQLADDVGTAGLPVDLDVGVDAAGLPRSVELAAFRIVQESLTNCLRHAGAHRATVRLWCERGGLVVEVSDDGSGPNGSRSGGHGLVGMRERVAVHGGSLETGTSATGGFRVLARLPYDQEAVA
jgi:signal transduction histidine kinase